MVVKIQKNQLRLFNQIGTIVKAKNGNIYRYLPYWFKETEHEGIYEILNFDKLPIDLLDALQDMRK